MDTKHITGQLILIMGPTGSGKGSIASYLLNKFSDLHYAVSCTTRDMRPGETDGKEYHYISRDQFKEKIAKGEFLEWAEFSGNLYGTLRSEIVDRLKKGEVVINEIEIQGVEQLMQLIPKEHLTLVFIEAGDWEVLKARAIARAPISPEHLELRHQRYIEEVKSKPYADVIIDNEEGKLNEANIRMTQLVKDIFNKVKQVKE